MHPTTGSLKLGAERDAGIVELLKVLTFQDAPNADNPD